MKLYKVTIIIVLVTAILLFIPWIAMRYTNEVRWDFTDFVIAGILLIGTGFSISFLLRKNIKPRNKYMWIVLVLLTLLLIWAELAVGIFGTPFGGS